MTFADTGARRRLAAVWPACAGALAILYATIGAGAWTRRSAVAWMIGSWGARLTVQALYTSRPERPRLLPSYVQLLASAVFFSLPALLASRNADPALSTTELAACALWLAAFAGETTADRQLLRFTSKPENVGRACRSGLWRYASRAHAMFEALIWVALALFASASPWGWIAWACPVVTVRRAVRGDHEL